MFDFVVQDAVEALRDDYDKHGYYTAETLSELKLQPNEENYEVNTALKLLGYPGIKRAFKPPKLDPVLRSPETILLEAAGVGSESGTTPENGTKELKFADLKSLQKTAIAYALDYHDKRALRLKLKDLKVTTTTWHEWLDDADFNTLLRRELDKRFKNLDVDARLSLSKLVLDGDLQAIKYYHEFTGLYRPQNESQVNLTIILARLMDVLVEHVPQESLETIAQEIEQKILLPLNPQPIAGN